MLLSERFPAVYPVSVAVHRAARRIEWAAAGSGLPSRDAEPETSCVIAKHSSLIYRRLAGLDMQLQRNKRRNLELACAALDCRVLHPEEELSFWRCVGPPSARRGFQPSNAECFRGDRTGDG